MATLGFLCGLATAADLSIPSGKLSIVLDTDAYNEVDDQFAIAHALLAPERLHVEAIYAAPFVNTRAATPAAGMRRSFEEIERVLNKLALPPERFDRGQVYRGATAYLPKTGMPESNPAVEDIIRRGLADRDQPLLIVALGAPTNVAAALLLEPRLVDRVQVMWLGTQTLSSDKAGDFNTSQDVRASQTLFDSGVALINIGGFNISEHLRTSIPELEHFLRGRSPIADYLFDNVLEYSKDQRGDPALPWSKVIWDVATTGMLINEDWVPSKIVPSPILTNQITWKQNPARHEIRVAMDVDRDAIFRDLFQRLSDPPASSDPSEPRQ